MNEEQDLLSRLERVEQALGGLSRRIEKLEGVEKPEEPQAPVFCAPPKPPRPVDAPRKEPPAVETPAAKLREIRAIFEPEHKRAPEPQRAAETAPPLYSPPLEPPAPAEDPPWVAALRRFKILPPRGSEMSMEVLIGTWWLPRIAVLLGVIGISLLAIYFSQETPPWMRFSGILAASIAICVLGWHIEERGYKDFGSVLFASGLALIFFIVFAGYAFPAVKIIQSTTAAAAWQFAVILLILSCAIWRRSSVVASLAVFLGYAACIFSFIQELHAYALAAAFLLAVVSSAFYLLKSWNCAYQIAAVGTYAVYGGILFVRWIGAANAAPPFAAALAFPLGAMVLFGASDFIACIRARLMGPRERRAVQLFSSSAAVLLGYTATRILFPESLSAFYFIFGAVLAAASIAFWLLNSSDAVAQGYFIKGTALLTLGVIAELGGTARYLALAAESFVLLFSAKRTRLLTVQLAMTAVWYASLLYFIRSIIATPMEVIAVLSRDGLFALLYTGASAILFSLHGRMFATPRGLPGMLAPADVMTVINAFAVGALASFVSVMIGAQNEMALRAGLIALALGSLWFIVRHWTPLLAAAVAYLWGHLLFLGIFYERAETGANIWLNASGLLAASWAIVAAATFIGYRRAAEHRGGFVRIAAIIHVLWLIMLHLCYSATFDAPSHVWLADIVTACAVAALAMALPALAMADLAFLPLAIVAGELLSERTMGGKATVIESGGMMAVLGALPLGFAITCTAVQSWRRRLSLPGAHNAFQWIHLVAASIIVWQILAQALSGDFFLFTLAAFSLLAGALRLWPGMAPGVPVGLAFVTFAHLLFFTRHIEGASTPPAVHLAILTALGALAQPILVRRAEPRWSGQTQKIIQGVAGVLALGLLFLAFLRQGGEWHNYITVCWGISACVVFLTGLAAGMKPLRIVGLGGLAVCLPRLFLVDIHSAIYRIAAFIGLCVVLLIIGFLYNRFRSVIERLDRPGQQP